MIVRFAFIEAKFGNGSVNGPSGLKKHLDNINHFVQLENYQKFNDLKEDTKKVFKQKISLGLIPFDKEHKAKEIFFDNEKPLFIILLADYKRKLDNLKKLIDEIDEDNYSEIDIKFSLGSFMGYGMYSDCLYSKEQILTHLEVLKNYN